MALDAARTSAVPARGFVDGTVNFNDVSSGIVLGFCLGLLRAAEEVLVGSDVISSIERRASAGLLCGRLVLIERRASGCSRMLADVRSGLERMARKASCCARRPKTSDPGVAKLVEAAEPGGGGQPSQEAAARRPAVTINAQPSPPPSPPPTTTPTPTPPSSAPPAAASAAAPSLSGVLGRVIEATVTIVGRASLTYGSPSSSLGSLWSAASITASTPCCYSLEKRRGFNDRGELVRASRPPGGRERGPAVYRIQGQVKSPQIRDVFHTGVYAQIHADL